MSADPFPRLGELQDLFWRLIAAPEGAARGAAALAREGRLASEDLTALVPDGDRMSAVEHIDVYADMYFYRLRDCLAEDFPKLSRWVGPARWNDLVTDYLLAHPPSHFSLRELGRAFPGFVAGHPLSGEFPCLADLARLEWARVDVFDEADATPLTQKALLAPELGDPEARVLGLVPSSRLLGLDRAILPLWKRLDESVGKRLDESVGKRLDESVGKQLDGSEDDPPRLEATGEVRVVLVWRKGFAIWHRSARTDEARCLESLADGTATLPGLGELVLESQVHESVGEPDPDRAAERLASLLSRWLDDALIRSF